MPSANGRSPVKTYLSSAFLRHIKLMTCVVTGVVLFFALPGHWRPIARLLVSWNSGVIMFLVWVFVWMSGCNAEQLYKRYKEEDETAAVILVTVICAALLSLAAIVLLLSTVKQVAGFERAMHVSLAALTVATSWTLVPTMFTLHFTDEYYSASDDDRPLLFPETHRPVFWDFAYFSFTISVACQTADVATANTAIRRVVLAQSLIAFVFNLFILGFAVNISAGLFSGS